MKQPNCISCDHCSENLRCTRERTYNQPKIVQPDPDCPHFKPAPWPNVIRNHFKFMPIWKAWVISLLALCILGSVLLLLLFADLVLVVAVIGNALQLDTRAIPCCLLLSLTVFLTMVGIVLGKFIIDDLMPI